MAPLKVENSLVLKTRSRSKLKLSQSRCHRHCRTVDSLAIPILPQKTRETVVENAKTEILQVMIMKFPFRSVRLRLKHKRPMLLYKSACLAKYHILASTITDSFSDALIL